MDKNKRKKPAIRRTCKLLGAAGLLALTIGTIGIFAVSGDSIQTSDVKPAEESSVTQVQTTTSATTQQTFTTSEQISWRKAGIYEYEIADPQQTTTTTTSAAASTASEQQGSQQTQQTPAVTTTTAVTTPPATTTTPAPTTTSPAVTTTRPAATTRAVTTTKRVTTTTKAATKAPAVKTVYNSPKIKSYTKEEFDMLCYVVQAEAGYCAEKYKIAVANVVLNRVKSPRFANNIKAVLSAPNQFTAISNYYTKANKPNASTINCCKRALNGEDNTNGAVYYYSPRYVGGAVAAWFESMQLCVAWDSARFFKPW